MDTYSLFRQIADSWVLLAMFCFFLGCIVWAFRPGSRKHHDEAASVIFRPDDTPGCKGGCAACTCLTGQEARHD